MNIDPGKLSHHARIFRPVETPDDAPDDRGDEPIDYVEQCRVWCSIEPLAGRELMLAQQMHGNVSHKIVMRYIAGITKRHQLRWNGKVYNLGPPLNTGEQGYELLVYATERA